MANADTVNDYIVTQHAGPKVAGVPVNTGATVKLTEAQARTELLAGAIVAAPKGDAGKDAKGKIPDPLEGSEKLKDTRARARGLDRAPAEAKADASADATAN